MLVLSPLFQVWLASDPAGHCFDPFSQVPVALDYWAQFCQAGGYKLDSAAQSWELHSTNVCQRLLSGTWIGTGLGTGLCGCEAGKRQSACLPPAGWPAPPPTGYSFDLSSQVWVACPAELAPECRYPNWTYSTLLQGELEFEILADTECYGSRVGSLSPTVCLTTQPPSREPTSPTLPTPVTLPYHAHTLWKGLQVTTLPQCIVEPGSTLQFSLEGSEASPSKLRGLWSSQQVEGDLRKTWTFHWSVPRSDLEEADPCTEISPSQAHTSPTEVDKNSEQHGRSRQAAQPNTQWLILTCTGITYKCIQNQCNQWWASDHTRAQTNYLHKQHTQRRVLVGLIEHPLNTIIKVYL